MSEDLPEDDAARPAVRGGFPASSGIGYSCLRWLSNCPSHTPTQDLSKIAVIGSALNLSARMNDWKMDQNLNECKNGVDLKSATG